MKKASYSIIFTLLIAILFAVIFSRKNNATENSGLIKMLYTNANDTISFDTSEYILETHIFTTPDKQSIVALIYLVNAKNFQIFTDYMTTGIYVLDRHTVQTFTPTKTTDSREVKFKLTEIGSLGSGLETDSFVDVIAEVRIYSTNNKYLVIARHQYFEPFK